MKRLNLSVSLQHNILQVHFEVQPCTFDGWIVAQVAAVAVRAALLFYTSDIVQPFSTTEYAYSQGCLQCKLSSEQNVESG